MMLICAVNLNAQTILDSIKLTYDGFSIMNIQTKLPSNVIYKRSLDWINENYKNPDVVITGNNINKNITINSLVTIPLPKKYFSSTLKYHLYITIYDSIIEYKVISDDFDYHKNIIFKNNEIKKNRLDYLQSIELVVNELYFSYY